MSLSSRSFDTWKSQTRRGEIGGESDGPWLSTKEVLEHLDSREQG